MLFRPYPLAAAGALALASTLLASNDARACGGCFHVPSETASTVVTGHRMAFAVSPTHTVLWDQVKYAGNPESFAWVLPIKPGARVELSTDAWFEALDGATTAQIVSPAIDCPGTSSGSGCGIGCGAMSFADGASIGTPILPPVTVVHQGTVGPYENVTLHANVPGALPQWLTSHGFAIDPAVQPVVDAYTKEGFDFIALRLLPDQGVQQMKPVRIISPGMSPTLPLRMVAAGTGANVDITLFVIGEGVWLPQNFPTGTVDPGSLMWDFKTSSSNYAVRRKEVLAAGEGRTWNWAFSQQGALLSPLTNPVDSSTITYQTDSGSPQTIAELYITQGIKNNEGVDSSCEDAFQNFAASRDQVVDLCGPSDGSGGAGGGSAGSGGAGGSVTGGGGAGGAGTSSGTGAGGAGASSGTGAGGSQPVCVGAGVGQIDAKQFACGGLDDVAVALQGLHPADVTITRIEASLPRAALATDLVLQGAGVQENVSNWFQVQASTNAPVCAGAAIGVIGGDSDRKGPWNRNRWALLATVLAALAATFGRRAGRPTNTLSRATR